MKWKTRSKGGQPSFLPRLLFLAACFFGGVCLGQVLAGRVPDETGRELSCYLKDYLTLGDGGATPASLWAAVVLYGRYPLLAFLLGFASIGVLLIPLLCAFEGFLFSFSLFCFASTLGRESFLLLLALFAVRMLFVLPCTLILSVQALDKARSLALFSIGNGKRVRPVSYGTDYWYRFGICCVCLLIGSVLELWLVPQFLALAAS